MTRVDTAVVQRLIEAKLGTVANSTVLYFGQPAPNDLTSWHRLETFTVDRPVPIDRNGADMSDIECTVVGVRRVDYAAGSLFAGASLAEEICAVLDQAGGIIDATSTHSLFFDRRKVVMRTEQQDQQLIQVAEVTFKGGVIRQTGSTLETYSPTA